MTHLLVREWGSVAVGAGGFSRGEADALIAAARDHPGGGDEGTGILSDHNRYLRAKQMVGIISAGSCSLEILPKVDPDGPDEAAATVRARLLSMLSIALGLDIGLGAEAAIARQADTLLDALIRMFADRLIAETRRGLPRSYLNFEEDLPAMRGSLNVVRQFTRNAVRPDRLACRFDTLSNDIPLMQVMKACVVFLAPHARNPETRRRIDELRFVLADISDVVPANLPWKSVSIDRTNRRWEALLKLARLFMRREWQATHRDARSNNGVTLLFAMNDLFEGYVAALLRRSLAGSDLEVVAQGGLRNCLGDWHDEDDCRGSMFQTLPDILLRRGREVVAVIDTKWKKVATNPLDRKHGVSQSDVYQMMAYARLYRCQRLMLLYPSSAGVSGNRLRNFGIDGGRELLAIQTLDVTRDKSEVERTLGKLALELIEKPALA